MSTEFGIDAFIDAVNNKEYNDAEKAFADLMADKVSQALEAEKMNVAQDVYDGVTGSHDVENLEAALEEFDDVDDEEDDE
jgi:hypothetical protein